MAAIVLTGRALEEFVTRQKSDGTPAADDVCSVEPFAAQPESETDALVTFLRSAAGPAADPGGTAIFSLEELKSELGGEQGRNAG